MAELSTGRPKRYPIAPQLPVTSEAANLRRSARLGSTAGITLPLKRKRPVERSAGRSSKRSHLIPADTLAPDLPSPRSQRHRRRHPSVFDDEYPSASTSYLLPSVDDEKRIRKKENNSQSSRGRNKGKGKADDESIQTMELDHATRSRTRSRTSDDQPTMSESHIKVKASKRKRASAADQTCKKIKMVELEADFDIPIQDAHIPYPLSLPNPIPTLVIIPPTPPNSPPPTDLPIPPILEESVTGQEWTWPAGTQPVLASESPSLDDALSSNYSSQDEFRRGRSQGRPYREKRVRRRRREPRITDKSPDTLFKLACRERVEHLKFYYLGQLQDYEADQAFAFFARLQSTPSDVLPDKALSSPMRPQSPTWNFAMHWQDRLHYAGEWDGRPSDIHPPTPPMTPLALPPSMFTLSPSADQTNVTEGELDFRTEDCYSFELVDSDDEEEERDSEPLASAHDDEQLPAADPLSDDPLHCSEESEDTESDESEESEDLSLAPPVQGESQLQLAVYTPTPSSLAEALTPLVPSEMQQTHATTGIFALPVPAPTLTKKPETEIQSPFPTKVGLRVEKSPTPPPPPPPPLSLPPPPLATIFPGQNRLQDSDQLTETFQLEIIPECAVAKMKALVPMDSPTTFAPVSSPVLLSQIRQHAHTRLRTPYTRLLNYASKKLGSIARGTPMDPKRRRSVVAWLEARETAQHPISMHVHHEAESVPQVGSAAWYALRFPSSLPSPPAPNPTDPQSSCPTLSTASTTPEALLSAANHSSALHVDGRQSSFDTVDWPPLTVQPADLETLRNHGWMDTKTYFEVGSTGTAQNVEFQQGSSRDCVPEVKYPYPHGGTPSRFSPEIAMDDADEDAEGDIDPDFVHPVGYNPSSTIIAPASSDSMASEMTTAAHGNDSYHHPSTSTSLSSLSGVQSSGGIGFHSSGSEGLYGSIIGGFNAGIGVHGHSNVEMPASVPVPNRSFLDMHTNSSFSSELGIQGVGMNMNLNLGVSVGFGMGGINRFGMDMMGIAFPALEPDMWFLPSSPTHSPPLSGPGTNGEENEHSLGGMGSSNLIYNDPLIDHTRERFGNPGSPGPESAYPLGYAMG